MTGIERDTPDEMMSLESQSELPGIHLVATITMEPTTKSEDLQVALTDMEATVVTHQTRSIKSHGKIRLTSTEIPFLVPFLRSHYLFLPLMFLIVWSVLLLILYPIAAMISV
jgi:hypothetical protein